MEAAAGRLGPEAELADGAVVLAAGRAKLAELFVEATVASCGDEEVGRKEGTAGLDLGEKPAALLH